MVDPSNLPDFDDHEVIHIFDEPQSGLRAIIAIHSTHLGPAGGGTRYWSYVDDAAALTDALRLSRGMSYKNAMAGLAMGGGKAVIFANAETQKTSGLIDAFARAIDGLKGQYVTAQDVGMSLDDMKRIAQTTPYVSGLPPRRGRAGGDPGPSTAKGVFLGIKAAVQFALGKDSVEGIHVAVQGVGSVGGGVARLLASEGAKLTLADLDTEKACALAAELGANMTDSDRIAEVPADVFSPCALGAILTADSIPQLQAPIIAGGANNQLATAADGDRLMERDVLYAPDFVINAGGIINVATGYFDLEGQDGVDARIAKIPHRLVEIWEQARASGVNASRVAEDLAKRLIGR